MPFYSLIAWTGGEEARFIPFGFLTFLLLVKKIKIPLVYIGSTYV